MLQPVGADHDVAENQREMFAPLLRHGLRQVAVTMRAVRSSGDLDFDDQQGQRDREHRIAESLDAVEPALGAMGLSVGALSHHVETSTARASSSRQSDPADRARTVNVRSPACSDIDEPHHRRSAFKTPAGRSKRLLWARSSRAAGSGRKRTGCFRAATRQSGRDFRHTVRQGLNPDIRIG
jgi:hypothetical protein